MIKSITHKGLRRFYETGKANKLPVQNHDKVKFILEALDVAAKPGDMDLPGLKFHPLPPTPRFSVWVNGNYRITFGWDGGPTDVEIEDYH